MGLWVGKKFTFLGLDYYWGTEIGGQKGKGPHTSGRENFLR